MCMEQPAAGATYGIGPRMNHWESDMDLAFLASLFGAFSDLFSALAFFSSLS